VNRLWIALLFASAPMFAEEPIAFSGFIDANFVWNANRPPNRQNFIPGTGTSGKRANELSLNLAQVQWSRGVSEEQPVGFTLALVAGDPGNAISGSDQTLREATLTYEMRPHEHLIFKLETRYDRSTASVFGDGERGQFLALAGAVVTF
jgi:hypothetical protein